MSARAHTMARVAAYRSAMASCDAQAVRAAIADLFAPDARIRLHHPVGDITGPEALWDLAYAPLFVAMQAMTPTQEAA